MAALNQKQKFMLIWGNLNSSAEEQSDSGDTKRIGLFDGLKLGFNFVLIQSKYMQSIQVKNKHD